MSLFSKIFKDVKKNKLRYLLVLLFTVSMFLLAYFIFYKKTLKYSKTNNVLEHDKNMFYTRACVAAGIVPWVLIFNTFLYKEGILFIAKTFASQKYTSYVINK